MTQVPPPVPGPGPEHEYVAGLIREATHEVCCTMLGLTPAPGAPAREQTISTTVDGVVVLLGIAGPWTGTGRLHTSAELACRLATALTDVRCENLTDDVLDAMAEIGNMIIGFVKTGLEERLGPLGLSVPTVIYGRNYHTRNQPGSDWTVIDFDCGGEILEVRLCLEPAAHHRPHRHPGAHLVPVD